MGAVPIGRPQPIQVDALTSEEASAVLDSSGKMHCDLVERADFIQTANVAATPIACTDGGLAVGQAKLTEVSVNITNAVRALAAVRGSHQMARTYSNSDSAANNGSQCL